MNVHSLKIFPQSKGGNARAIALSSQQRSEIARKAALARWSDHTHIAAINTQRAHEDQEWWRGFCPEGAVLLKCHKRRKAIFLMATGKKLHITEDHVKWVSEMIRNLDLPHNR